MLKKCLGCKKTFRYKKHPKASKPRRFCTKKCAARTYYKINKIQIKGKARKYHYKHNPIYCKNCDILLKFSQRKTGIAFCSDDCRKQRLLDEYSCKRLAILEKVGRGKIFCTRCGCNNVNLLEINHKNGGGRQEKLKRRMDLNTAIYYGHRSIKDLELLCKVCNAAHAALLKINIDNWNIKWKI